MNKNTIIGILTVVVMFSVMLELILFYLLIQQRDKFQQFERSTAAVLDVSWQVKPANGATFLDSGVVVDEIEVTFPSELRDNLPIRSQGQALLVTVDTSKMKTELGHLPTVVVRDVIQALVDADRQWSGARITTQTQLDGAFGSLHHPSGTISFALFPVKDKPMLYELWYARHFQAAAVHGMEDWIGIQRSVNMEMLKSE